MLLAESGESARLSLNPNQEVAVETPAFLLTFGLTLVVAHSIYKSVKFPDSLDRLQHFSLGDLDMLQFLRAGADFGALLMVFALFMLLFKGTF
ncbi:MAG: hypothetical protein KGI41_00770 [Patescibacteria group bacterium]|nr:hypothetical protein [Patescibacteria group bacterium]MDE1965762.1 hypothetical protein [Patescibacteria group bacterium]